MPRDGTTVYNKPFPDVINNTTIESVVYNGFVNDVANDLNNPRPILSGGTAANNARDAMLNLKGEIALQQVANYDSHPWVNGSFWSAAGATAAPNTVDAFIGEYYANAAGDHATLHARANTGTPFGKLYIRQKIAGVWQSTWTLEDQPLDDKKVNRSGDVMVGVLAIDMDNPALVLDKAASTNASYLLGQTNALARWRLDLGDNTTESGTQAGSNFVIRRYTNAGLAIDAPLTISRETGAVTLPGSITIGGTINVSGGGTATFAGPISAPGVTSTGNLTINGTTMLVGAATLTNDLTVSRSSAPTTGYILYGNVAGKSFGFDGTAYQLVGGALNVPSNSITAGTSLHAGTSIHAGSSIQATTTITAGGTISTPGAVNGDAHSTFGNLTAKGGVVYLNSANSDYIQASGWVLNYRGQTILHSGNYTSYFPASVTSQYWAHVGDFQIPQDWNFYNPYGSHVVVSDISHISSYGGVTERCRALYNVINGSAYVVGAAS